ncbi:hypothetical protein CONLIGDRAFT_713710 [Coniochaeta ligniaria NRRL 30616]|uniref:Uncharacterized protein n=1 Tax=Coniochaeta ligniaria NRRL 30616 TaxID=1408157 RepID=A0A1J7JPI8_9PEZI|nr:hypothetical protein CONLIGDRAFT_713710 [Coniochaeta ligniaria NRRL 30616]
MTFTFLNTTGAPELSQSDAKRMRAHITKTNFANRRQRLRESGSHMPKGRSSKVALTRHARPGNLLLATPPKDPYRYAQYLSQFWSLVMVDGAHFPRNADEEAFLRDIASEAALAEVSLAIGMRHWSPDTSVQRKAVIHSSKAANIVIQRIKSETAHNSAVLGAVLSMAIGERLMNNTPIWNIHVDGLAKMITERLSQGEHDLPALLCNFLIIDSINHVFGFPLAYHRKIIDAIRPYGGQPVCEVADICEGLIQLRKSVDVRHSPSSRSDPRAGQIENDWNSLLCRARALRSQDNPYLQAASRSMELILHLSPFPQQTNFTLIAGELKDAWGALPVRPCLFMDLASCQLMLGAVAAGGDSEIRAWFVARMRRAVVRLRSRGWGRPLEILERGFVSDDGLVERFRVLWKELAG